LKSQLCIAPRIPNSFLLAATALHHDLRMVTRNVQDFSFPDLEVINPWE